MRLIQRAFQKAELLAHTLGASFAACGLPITSQQKALRQLRRRHIGQIAFLIGNGPSVRSEDLDALIGRTSFCCNRFYLAYEKFRFRPSHLVSSDSQMIADFGNEMVAKAGCDVWLVADRRPAELGRFHWVKLRYGRQFTFFRNVGFGASPGGATLVAATQIGYHLGIRHFFLYGVDHSFNFQMVTDSHTGLKRAQGDNNHFISGYRSGKPWIPPATALIEESFKICDSELRKEGGWIKNATRGGALDVLERVSFEEALQTQLPSSHHDLGCLPRAQPS